MTYAEFEHYHKTIPNFIQPGDLLEFNRSSTIGFGTFQVCYTHMYIHMILSIKLSTLMFLNDLPNPYLQLYL